MVPSTEPSSGDGPPPGLLAAEGLSLLLFSSDPAWARAVGGALRGAAVVACDARGALTRLAGIDPAYSHLLLQSGCDDGLLDALVQLTTAARGSETEIVMLGGSAAPRRGLATISAADPGSVREAFMAGTRPTRSDDDEIDAPSLDPAALGAALDGAMIGVRYQPIVRLSDGAPRALEVLARLDHPDRGTVLPDRFVPAMEDAGLAARLTEAVAARAFADLRDASMRADDLAVTLNFPLDVLLRAESLDVLDAQRAAAGIAADRIVIELTESMPVRDFDELARVLETVRGRGYRAAIDDVAPSVPGVDRLLELPFTSVKLDKGLVFRSAAEPEVVEYLRDIAARARARGKTVVAEGIETDESWRRMRDIGVELGQGFLIARPLPARAVPIWRNDWDARRPYPAAEGSAGP